MPNFTPLTPGPQSALLAQLLASQQAPNNIGQGIFTAGQALAQGLSAYGENKRRTQQNQERSKALASALQGLPANAQQSLAPLAQDPELAPMLQAALTQRTLQTALPEPVSQLDQQKLALQERGLNLDERALQQRSQLAQQDQAFRQQQLQAQLSQPQSQVGKLAGDLRLARNEYGKDSPQAQAIEATLRGLTQPQSEADLGDETGLRKEFVSNASDFVSLRSAFNKVKAATPTAAGDIALVFNFMKILDPTSVVREGEFATAQNAAGVPERIRNTLNRLMSGERLSPEQREDFEQQARNVYASQLEQHRQLEDQFRGIAQRIGVNPENVIVDFVGDAGDVRVAGGGGGSQAPAPQRFGEVGAAEVAPQQGGGFSLGTDVTKLKGDELDAYARWLDEQGF